MYPPLKTIHERKKKKKAQGTQTNFVDHDVEQLFSGFIFLSRSKVSWFSYFRDYTLYLSQHKSLKYLFSTSRTIM